MGDSTPGSPIPSRLLSKHILSVKKTPFAAFARVDQSVTARYNLVVEPGLPVSPLQGGPAFLLPVPWSYAFSYVQVEILREVLYIRPI
jgi:hypothetical protein